MKGVLSALFAMLLVLTGCSSSSTGKEVTKKIPQVFRFNIQQEPSSLDPRKVTTIQDINVCRAFMDGLYRVDKMGTLQPALAQSHTVSNDGLVYTFYLRDAVWSDGTKISAQDFIYSWKSLLSPRFPSQAAYHLYPIKNAELVKKGTLPSSMLGVEAKDEKTIVVTLSHPVANFIGMTAHPIFFPIPSKVDKKNPKWPESIETYVSSGPFLPVEWKHHYSIVAEKNPKYWDANVVRLDKLEMVMVSSETELRMYEANELDWAGSPISLLSPELAGDGPEVHKAPFLNTKIVRINTTNKLLSSAKIRRAFSLAIDRQAISEHMLYNMHDPAYRFVPACMQLHDEAVAVTAPEEARVLFEEGLDEMKLSREDLSGLVLYFMNEELNKKYAETIQEQWREHLGIEVTLQAQEQKVLMDTMVNKQYDFALSSWVADVDDPMNFLEVFRSMNVQSNRTGWENSEYAALLEEAFHAANAVTRREILSKSEHILLEESPIIPLTHHSLLYKHKPMVQDVIVTPLGNIDFKWAHVEEAL